MSRSSTSSSSPPSSNFRRSVRFAGRCAFFVLPLLAWSIPLEVVLWKSGDAWPIDVVAARQTPGSNILFGRAFMSQQYNVYKTEMTRRRKPALLVVGSSRVMQFRKEMFAPVGDRFYNAGGLLQSLADVEQLAAQWRTGKMHRPRAAILGVDPWWLSRGRPNEDSWLRVERMKDATLRLSGHFHAVARMTRRLVDGGRLIPDPNAQRFGYEPIGAQAVGADGFRPDGSRLYGTHLIDAQAHPGYRDRESPPIIERVRRGLRRFEPSDGLDPARVERLSAALAKMREVGVELSVVVIPVSTEVGEALRTSEQLQRWWREYLQVVPPIVEGVGGTVVVAPTPSRYGLTDEAMFDGNHPGELLVSHLAEELVAEAPVDWLLAGIDVDRIRAIRNARHPLGPAPDSPP